MKARSGERIADIHTLLQTLADVHGGVMTRIRHQNAELIAANPRKNVRLAKSVAQNPRGGDESAVAFQMPVVVVNQFQFVKIHINEQSRSLASNHSQLLLRKRQKSAMIMQAGQVVDERKTLQRPLQTVTLNSKTQ